MKRLILLSAVIFTLHLWGAPPVVFHSPKAAWKVLTEHKNQISRRSAYIYLVGVEPEREKVWLWALQSNDPVLRRDAIFSYYRSRGEEAARKMLAMKPEKDPVVQKTLRDVIRQVKSPELRKQLAAKQVNPQKQTQTGQLYRNNIRLKDDPTYDHEVSTVKKISLANENWKIWFDKNNTGVRNKIFLPGFDDRSWEKITVNKNWEAQGHSNYDGFAWYRVSFKAPPKNDYAGAEFYFPLVDEEAWIWLNGTYLGQRAEGPEAWSKPFFMDASKEIRWGEINQLTVRVFDSAKAGGICKEPQLHLLKQE